MTSVAFPKSIFSELAANLPRHGCRTGESITMSFKLGMRIRFCSGFPGTALLLMVAFVGLGSAASAFAQHTYYVSKSAGSDSNSTTQAQSKSTPWAHLPGMASATSTAAGYSASPGDTFILKGCDVWTASDLPVYWGAGQNAGGSSGNLVTITVDKTWYNTSNCPSAWNRPVFSNSGHVALANTNCNNDGSNGQNQIFICFGTSSSAGYGYIVLDNIEMTGLTCTGSCTGTQSYIWQPGCANCKFTNNYLHGLNIAYDNGGACTLIKSYEYPSNTGTLYQNNIVDGSDRTNPSAGGQCDAFYGDYGGATIDGNVIHDIVNPLLFYAGGGSTLVISRNQAYNVLATNGSNHCNLLEVVGGGTLYVYSNVLHDLECSGGESFMDGNGGETMYAFNNVIYNLGSGQTPSIPQTAGQTGISLHYYNNTVVSPGGQSCWNNSGQTGSSYTAFVLENNHCIGTGNLADTWGSYPTLTTNVLMTPSTATGQGYTSSETYTYSPAAATNGTVGAGTNLTSSCSGSAVSLCSDTAYACTYNSSSETISCPAREVNAKPPSGAWDAGSYLYVAGGAPPNPPTGLTAVVQ
jgi:hypothetical protein